MQFCVKFVSFAVGFGNSLAQGSEELWRCQNSCIFGADFGVSLAQSAEELWRSQNLCLSGADFGIFSGPKC